MTLPSEVKAALREAAWQAIKSWDIERSPGEGCSHATGTDAETILTALQPEIERLLLDALYDLRARKQVLPVHGGNDSLQPSRYVEVVMVSALDLLISKHELALTHPKQQEEKHG